MSAWGLTNITTASLTGFIGKKIKLLYSSASVEAFYHYERIAMHKRTRGAHLYTTEDDHMASAHQFVTDWSRISSWDGPPQYMRM